MKCINCDKDYTRPMEGNWKKDGTVGRGHGSIDSSRFCCFKCGQEYAQKKRKEKWKSAFNDPNVRKKARDTIKKRFGCNNVFQNKNIQNKIKQTNIQKYGVDNPAKSNTVKAKIHNTNLLRYGGTLLGSKQLKEKIQNTNMQKYGTIFPQQTPTVKEKAKQTNLLRHGVIAPMMSTEIKEKASANIQLKYGVDWNCMLPQCKEKGSIISEINKSYKQELERRGIRVELEKNIMGHYAFDLYLPDQQLLIDINPTISHQSTTTIPTHFGIIQPRAKDYHITKLKIALTNSYACMMIWDWDDKIKILNNLQHKTILYARQLCLKEVSEIDTNIFLNAFHYQNTCKNQTIRLGLYKDDELIQLITFGKPRYNNKYQYELLRLCTHNKYKVVGGAQKLFKYFLTKYTPNSIISYCDNSKFKGSVYTSLGFTLINPGIPNKHWYNTKTKKHITNNLLLQRGYSQLHNNKHIGKNISNELLMLQDGYLEVYDCGQATYIWL